MDTQMLLGWIGLGVVALNYAARMTPASISSAGAGY
jgi:hypothetical protein